MALWAYVIMPEHVHVLLHPRSKQHDMRRILALLKQPVSRAAREWLEENRESEWLEKLTVVYPSRQVFRFWQPGGGFDHNLFKQKTVATIVDYIHANPVRRQLADEPTQWQWSSARFWAGSTDVPLRMDDPF